MKPHSKFFLILILCFCPACSFAQCYDIYALSRGGGEYGAGAIVNTDENGNSKKVYSFYRIDTWHPYSQFCRAVDGSLYALSPGGGKRGQGVLFQWDPETNEYIKKIDFRRDVNSSSDSGAWKPYGPLIQGTNGKFYGMTRYGGKGLYDGVIFEWDAITGNYTEKHWFDSESGREPLGAMVQTGSGLMYGLTSKGGANYCGVLFEWDPESGSFLKLLDFDSLETGFDARGSLCEADNGKLYGTARSGGIHGHGVLFEYNPATGNFLKIYDFNGSETGSHPESSLVLAENGKLYSTTIDGGLYGYGVLFELDPQNNEFHKLLDFDNAEKGRNPVGPLTLCESGLLVGVTLSSVFEFETETKTFTKKCSFESQDLHPTSSLVQAENGKFYGFSGTGGFSNIEIPPFSNYGVIYEWDPALDTCTIKLMFQDTEYGSWPLGLVVSDNGKFYGTSVSGNYYCNWGIIFEFDPGKGEFQRKSGLRGVNPGPLMKANNGNFYGVTGEDLVECSMFKPTLFEWDPVTEKHTIKYAKYFFDLYSPKGNIPPLNGHLIEANNKKIYFGSRINTITEWDVELDTLINKYYFEEIDGRNPEPLLSAKNGKLLGFTAWGGLFNRGTLFEWDPETDHFNKLLDFTDSTQMFSLIQTDDSLFYGVSNRGSLGLFYGWNQQSNTFQVLHRFNNIDANNWTLGEDLTLADNGKLYGTLNTTDSGFYFFEWDPVNNSLHRLFDLDKSQYIDIVMLKRYSGDTINVTSCNEYVSPSGKYAWSESGVYRDTIQCVTGCDSVLTINLIIHNSSAIAINETSCNTFISPSGKIWNLPGLYTDTIPGIYGCDSVITVNLTIQSADTAVTRDQSVLTANAAGAAYQWINCGNDNAPVEGETHQTFTPTENGYYAVIISQNGCVDTSECFNVHLTSLLPQSFKQGLTLYPNPNDGSFSIDLGKVCPGAEITITEMDGRIIQKNHVLNSQHIDLQISAFPGLYMVIVTAENERAVFRMLKK